MRLASTILLHQSPKELSFPVSVGWGHHPDPLQESPQASWITLIVEFGAGYDWTMQHPKELACTSSLTAVTSLYICRNYASIYYCFRDIGQPHIGPKSLCPFRAPSRSRKPLRRVKARYGCQPWFLRRRRKLWRLTADWRIIYIINYSHMLATPPTLLCNVQRVTLCCRVLQCSVP